MISMTLSLPPGRRFTNFSGYYGLSLNAVQLSADPYLGAFMSAAVELPAFACVWLVLQYLSRRVPLMMVTVLGGASLLFTQLVPPGSITEG